MKHILGSLGLRAALVIGFATLGCSSSDNNGDDGAAGSAGTAGASGTGKVQIELFSWWVAPGEAEALDSLVKLHHSKFPKETIYNAAVENDGVGSGAAKMILADRLAAGDPPDVFQTNAYEVSAFKKGLLEPLDDLFKEQKLDDIAPEVLEQVKVGGKILSMPVNVHRDNGLFYNKAIFNENNLTPPTTIAEFLDTCAVLKKAGVTPLAISTSQYWIIEKVFLSLALGTMGPDDFVKYFVDKEPATVEGFQASVDVLDEVLTNYIDVEAAATEGYGWTQAADDLYDGKAAMFMHGDWTKGYLAVKGWTDDDYGVVSSPDSGGAFIYGIDVFAIPTGAKHRDAAMDFVTTVASPDGQVRFNGFKGSTPVRLAVSTKDMDPVAKAIYKDFQDASIRIPGVGLRPHWQDALGALAKDHDKDALIQTFIDNP